MLRNKPVYTPLSTYNNSKEAKPLNASSSIFDILLWNNSLYAKKKTLCVKHFTLELNYQNDATDLKKEILTVLEAWRGIEKNYSLSQKSCFGPNSYGRMTQD